MKKNYIYFYTFQILLEIQRGDDMQRNIKTFVSDLNVLPIFRNERADSYPA